MQPSAEQLQAIRQELRAESEAFAGRGMAALIADDSAMQVGEKLFDAHCASCHGLESPARRGVPDLRTHKFNYGNSEQAVRTTIREGRVSVMPNMGQIFGEVDLGQLVAFVQSVGFESTLSSYAERGKMLFTENCAKCHGTEGSGNPELGAPDLTDGYWQHGDSMMNIRLVITRGAQSQCPGYTEGTDTELDLLTAFVLKSAGRDLDAHASPEAAVGNDEPPSAL